MENFLWAMGIVDEPHLSKCRVGLTKFVCILTAIDDIYDVYGSLSELECFTNAVKRYEWGSNFAGCNYLTIIISVLENFYFYFYFFIFLFLFFFPFLHWQMGHRGNKRSSTLHENMLSCHA